MPSTEQGWAVGRPVVVAHQRLREGRGLVAATSGRHADCLEVVAHPPSWPRLLRMCWWEVKRTALVAVRDAAGRGALTGLKSPPRVQLEQRRAITLQRYAPATASSNDRVGPRRHGVPHRCGIHEIHEEICHPDHSNDDGFITVAGRPPRSREPVARPFASRHSYAAFTMPRRARRQSSTLTGCWDGAMGQKQTLRGARQ